MVKEYRQNILSRRMILLNIGVIGECYTYRVRWGVELGCSKLTSLLVNKVKLYIFKCSLHKIATPADFFVIRKVLNSKFIKCSSSKAAQNSLNFADTFTRTKVTAV